MKLRVATPAGRLVCEGPGSEWLEAARPIVLAACERDGPAAHRCELGRPATEAWFKGSHLAGRARIRHALRSGLLLSPLPRVREARNLAWLRERGFRAPLPLCAGRIERGGTPVYQFLFTELVPWARPLDRTLEVGDSALRFALVQELARETAHLHSLGFVHRDLYARNFLVAREEASPRGDHRLVFIDCWRGGAGLSLRGPDYDLACLMLEGAVVWEEALARAFFHTYFERRRELARPVDPARVLARTARMRRSLLERVRRQPGRWRARQAPPSDCAWDWEALIR